MPTKPNPPAPLAGDALLDTRLPQAATPQGGREFGFTGETVGKGKKKPLGYVPVDPQATGNHPGQTGPHNATIGPSDLANEGEPDVGNPFEGMGSWLEDDDATVYQTAQDLVLRQELIAQNRLAIDTYFTRVKLGYPFAVLSKDVNKNVYRTTLPAGVSALSIQATPNKAWDLVNKATEAVLVDPAQADPSPLNDSEEALAAAELAGRFLAENGGENGTNDVQLLYRALDAALTRGTSYIEYWTDPTGGGYVPLKILAHPEAQSPMQPMIGPDGMPTSQGIERYVTGPIGPDGKPQEGSQFTNDPSQAAPQWQPKIRAQVWGREHWRVYPESQPVPTADLAIGLLYCTIKEAKERWPEVAAMTQDEINSLLNWTPPRYLVLLPPFQRARWASSYGSDQQKGSSDERIIFYYRILQKARPDHPKGAEVIVTGAMQGKILDKRMLAAPVEIQTNDGTGPKTEVRCMDLPLAQLTPRQDPDDRDPTGRVYMELFCGATEADAALMTGFLQALNQWLNPDRYIPSTSPVEGFQVEESRATGNFIPILRPEDKPIFGEQPAIPPAFFEAVNWNDQAIRSIASLDKAVTGQEDPTKESGKALQVAVSRAMVGLARMQYPTNDCYKRMCRIVLQLAMRDYTTQQTLRYVGEDGSWQEQEWTGVDFALVGNVDIKPGTGSMMSPEQKVNYLASLRNMGLLPDPDEAADAARPSYAKRLGLPDNPHQQFIERCVATWLDGPPEAKPSADPMQPPAPSWVQQWQQYAAQKQAYDAQVQTAQHQQQVMQAVANADAQQGGAAVSPPAPQLGPAPQMPWTPFPPKPNDTEPAIAKLWMRRLSRLMSTAKYFSFPPEWRQVVELKYGEARQIVAAATAPPPLPSAPAKAQLPAGQSKPAQPQTPQAA